MAASGAGEAVHVALHQFNEAVALDPLPQDALDVIELLSAEAAPIPVWLDAAKAFMAQGNVSSPLTSVCDLDLGGIAFTEHTFLYRPT